MTLSEGQFWNWKDKLITVLDAGGHIEDCSAQGDCEEACRAALEDRNVIALLGDSPEFMDRIIDELFETGAWELLELEANEDDMTLVRFIWILCCEERAQREADDDWTSERNREDAHS